MTSALVQICPRGAGGVRDYADCLARAWTVRGVDSQLLEGTRDDLRARLEALLEPAAPDSPLHVVLHFSGYGYGRRGLCEWLADDLAQVRLAAGARMRLVVVFHELFALGPPWRSAFWLTPWQSRVARRLARLSDSLWTNSRHHGGWLHEATGGRTPLRVRPVFSNVGEPTDAVDWHARVPQAIVFGSAATRARAFRGLRGHAATLARLDIREIVEAGDGDSQAGQAQALGMPMRHLGRLSTGDLGALLAGSRFGVLDYPARHLGKSGVFAAYAAHGCVAVDTDAGEREADGLRAGLHYVDLRTPFDLAQDALAAMATRLHRWYGAHSLALQSRELLLATTAAQAAPVVTAA
jgi:hypothetical protein